MNRHAPELLTASETAKRSARVGVAYGLAAYLAWGLVPIYFKAVAQVAPLEVLTHRVIWSVALLAGLMLARRRVRLVLEAARSRRTMVTLLGTTVLIACNWFIFIWSVANNHVLQASLGYYINPLVNVLLGVVFLKERLRPGQTVSVVLAATGVTYLALSYGRLPWIALMLAGSFGLYGLLRKTAPVGSLVGLTVETTLLAPLAVGYALYLWMTGNGSFARGDLGIDGLLALAGVVTAVPLLWFTSAARRLRLTTMGFLQYLAPTGHFLLAVLAYREQFTAAQAVTFVCIWAALAIYSFDTVRAGRAVRRVG